MLQTDDRIPVYEACQDIMQRIQQFCSSEGTVSLVLNGWWNGELQWARNRIWVATDRRDIRIHITRRIDGGTARITANQTDDSSLQAAVIAAERIARRQSSWESEEFLPPPPVQTTPVTTVWSDATYNATAETRAELARTLMRGAEEAGMLSAGNLEMRAGVVARLGTTTGSEAWDDAKQTISVLRQMVAVPVTYQTYTQAQCSMTVRHPRGTGSGWAGLSGYDWSRIDGPRLASRALEKCLLSIDPVRIEPGRYTVVLEPQATCDLLEPLMRSFTRTTAESGSGPWAAQFDDVVMMWRSKLGMSVVDSRVTISHDPMDSEIGVVPWPGLAPMTWIDRGVLTTLEFGRTNYALPRLNTGRDASGRSAFRMSGGTSTLEEMIQATQRGLLVSRLSGVMQIEGRSMLCTGVTRDGLWLIEKGKISKAVQNMRFTESPLFVLNQLDLLGEPMPVFRPMQGDYQMGVSPAIVPAIQARDFSFTSLNDAI